MPRWLPMRILSSGKKKKKTGTILVHLINSVSCDWLWLLSRSRVGDAWLRLCHWMCKRPRSDDIRWVPTVHALSAMQATATTRRRRLTIRIGRPPDKLKWLLSTSFLQLIVSFQLATDINMPWDVGLPMSERHKILFGMMIFQMSDVDVVVRILFFIPYA